MPFRAIGYAFSVDSSDPDVLAFVGELLQPLRVPGGDSGALYQLQPNDSAVELTLDGAVVGAGASVAEAVDVLLSHINLAAVEADSTQLRLHAGGVSRGADAVVLPARTGSGKSSLTIALVEAGLDYLTDETVAVDVADLAVTPYPKPFTVKSGGQHLFPRLAPAPGSLAARFPSDHAWHVPPDAVRPGCVATATAYPRLVVAPQHKRGAALRIDPLSRGEAMVVLGGNSSALASLGPAVLDVLDRITRRAPAYRVTFGHLHEARDAVLDLVAEHLA